MNPIKKLSQCDIDRIAAGEVIQRPRNAVKELIENSLDAGATNIHVTVKCYPPTDFKLIKIKDDGHGFRKEDLPLACERFATSKLGTYDDLNSIQTFGFRGEALASISRVARVSILSRNKNSVVGYQMDYENGSPKTTEPVSKAANIGSIISIIDLFHNDKKRRSTLPNVAEEYNKILELLSLYSLNNTHVSFRLSKEGSANDDLRTMAGEELVTRVKNVMGSKVACNLIPLILSSDEYKFKADGLFGDLNSSLKSYKITMLVMFVNKRLVECAPLKKAIEAIYKSRLSKGSCPFVLLSLNITAALDVNIHPTKQEVRFDYEEQVIDSITKHIETTLTARTISNVGSAQKFGLKTPSSSSGTISKSPATSSPSSRPDLMNRSDHSIQTVDSMMRKQKVVSSRWREVKLTSVRELRDEINDDIDDQIKTLLNESTYVGIFCSSKSTSMIFQSGTSLHSILLEPLSRELFYQKFLSDFGNFGVIELEQKPAIEDLLKIHLNTQNFDLEGAIVIIMDQQAMIDDYFSIIISDEHELCGLPIVINGSIPNFKKLPKFLYDLAFNVDWTEEKKCFKSFGVCLSKFYAISELEDEEELEDNLRENLFPVAQKKLKPSSALKDHISNITNVPTLYKVFHRC